MNELKEKQAYRIEDFCEAYGICRSKVYQEIKKRRLSAFKFGRMTYISRDAAQEWFKRIQAESSPVGGAKAGA